MAFTFQCPHCHFSFDVAERFRGQRGQCAECGKPIELPGFRSEALERLERQAIQENQNRIYRRSMLRRWLSRGLAVLILAVIASVISWLVVRNSPPMTTAMRSAGQSAQTVRNMQSIAQALLAYDRQYGQLPPAALVDTDGTPLLSWRVLILPQLGYKQLYARFDLTKPWDSPENSPMIPQMPPEYSSMQSVGPPGLTSVSVVQGPGTFFPSSGVSRSIADASDAAGTTILLFESGRGEDTWTAPFDVSFTAAGPIRLRPGSAALAYRAIAADGQPLYLPIEVPRTLLHAAASISGGEDLQRAATDWRLQR